MCVRFFCTSSNTRARTQERYFGIIYSWKFTPKRPHPLNGRCYIGQSIRVAKRFEDVLAARSKEHYYDSKSNPKEVGFHALLDEFRDASFWEVRVCEVCPIHHDRHQIASWANAREQAIIRELGGPLRDMQASNIKQTLNLTWGGRGSHGGSSMHARSKSLAAWDRFLAALRTFKRQHGHCQVAFGYKMGEYNLGYAVQRVRSCRSFIPGHDDWLQVLREMGFVFKPRDEKWKNCLHALLAFVERNGHCRVPCSHIEAGYKLGMAVGNVRTRSSFIVTHPERRAILENMGLLFDVQEARWHDFVDALRAYVARTGNCRVQRAHKEGNYKLGSVVNHVRASDTFIASDPGRRRMLEDMGFVFDEYEARWQDLLNALRSFIVRTGHCRVPRHYKDGEYNLGDIVANVRHSGYFIRARPDRRRVLEQMGFIFDVHEMHWQDFLKALRSFKARVGNCDVLYNYKDGEYTLGRTVASIRSKERFIRTRPDRRQVLEQMGFNLGAHEAKWQRFLSALRAYVERNGHCFVPLSAKEGDYNLGKIVSNIRCSDSFVKNHPSRRQLLERMGFPFHESDGTWIRFIQALRQFVLRMGHCDVPARHKEGEIALGGMVRSVRWRESLIKRRGIYFPDRVNTLLQLGFVWSSDPLKNEERRSHMQGLMSAPRA